MSNYPNAKELKKRAAKQAKVKEPSCGMPEESSSKPKKSAKKKPKK